MKAGKFILGGALLTGGYMLYKSMNRMPKCATPVSPFDVNKYLGDWYEIARFEHWYEKGLSDTSAHYSKNEDGSIKVINRGYNPKKDEFQEAEGKAKFTGNPAEGALKVSFYGPFYSGYNVIAVDDEYKYALVAGKNLHYLWILSRTKSIPEDVLVNYLQIAEEIGYDISKLVWVDQSREYEESMNENMGGTEEMGDMQCAFVEGII